MLPKERVLAAFEREEPDRIPIYQAGFSSRVASYILGREAYVGGGIQLFREAVALWEGGEKLQEEFVERTFEDAAELCQKLDLDMVRTAYWRMSRPPAERIDENTFLYGDPTRKGDWELWRFDPATETYGVFDRKPQPEPDIEQMRRLAEDSVQQAGRYDPKPEDFPEHLMATERFGGTRAIQGPGVGISIPREEHWLTATITHPDVVGQYLDGKVVMAEKNAAVNSQMGLSYGFGGGDFAGSGGPFYSPKVFHELMLPRLQRISRACHNLGVRYLFSSDGNLWPVAGDLFGASGVDGFFEIDRNYMDMRDLRRRFPELILLGGIRSEVLHRGTVEDVEEETRSALKIAEEIRGCVIGCSNQIVPGTPEENFWVMMEILHRER